MRTDKLTQKLRDKRNDIRSGRVEKQRETENGHKTRTVKGRQNEPKQKGQTAKQDRKEKDKKNRRTDRRNSKSLKDSKKNRHMDRNQDREENSQKTAN